MNDETEALLYDVVGRLQKHITAHDCPAVVALQSKVTFVLSDFDYLRDAATAAKFEDRAADKALELEVDRWVLAVPQVWVITPEKILTRAVSNHPLREGEQEAITWMSYDRRDGVDYGRVPYVRRPNGEPIFDEPEVVVAQVEPSAIMPGYRLLQACIAGSAPEGTDP